MQIVTSWMERGIEQGMERTLLRQLNRRFGPLTEARVVALDVAQLDALADALLDFASVEEVDAWLEAAAPADRTEDSA